MVRHNLGRSALARIIAMIPSRNAPARLGHCRDEFAKSGHLAAKSAKKCAKFSESDSQLSVGSLADGGLYRFSKRCIQASPRQTRTPAGFGRISRTFSQGGAAQPSAAAGNGGLCE